MEMIKKKIKINKKNYRETVLLLYGVIMLLRYAYGGVAAARGKRTEIDVAITL